LRDPSGTVASCQSIETPASEYTTECRWMCLPTFTKVARCFLWMKTCPPTLILNTFVMQQVIS
jgi:hypothetical protein